MKSSGDAGDDLRRLHSTPHVRSPDQIDPNLRQAVRQAGGLRAAERSERRIEDALAQPVNARVGVGVAHQPDLAHPFDVDQVSLMQLGEHGKGRRRCGRRRAPTARSSCRRHPSLDGGPQGFHRPRAQGHQVRTTLPHR